MSATCNGGAAFPHLGMPTPDYRSILPPEPGMTLRDYFAAQAAAAFVKRFPMAVEDGQVLVDWRLAAAHESYALADALLAERGKGGAA